MTQSRSQDDEQPLETSSLSPRDATIIERARENHGETFVQLWNGRLSEYDSLEEADKTLCCILAHSMQGGCNLQRIDDLFRQSNLMRDEWDEQVGESTYGEIIVDEAIQEIESRYGDNSSDDWRETAINSIESRVASHRRENDGNNPSGQVLADYGAEEIQELDRILVLDDTEEVWAYNPETGLWNDNGEQIVRSILDSAVGPLFNSRLLREVCEKLRAQLLISREELGVPDGTIAVENGLLKITQGSIRDLRPSDRATWRLPVTYDPEATCPRFREFLDDICVSEATTTIQEFSGYVLDHHSAQHKRALMILGPTDAGKSVLLDVLLALFGENAASVTPQFLSNQRWGLAQLVDEPVNIRHDLDPEAIERPGPIKEIISGNRVMVERKYESPFEVELTTKHIFAANQVPEVNSSDEAFWNRWLTVIVPERIPKEEQDPKLTEKLTTEEELSGILNWALEGYQRLEKQGKFTHEPTPQEIRKKWLAYGDSVGRFLSSNLIITGNRNDYVQKSLIYDRYTDFAERENRSVETKNSFTRKLTSLREITTGDHRIDGGDPVGCYEGITLRDRN